MFANPCYEEQVGLHYAGPTWESNNSGKASGSRLAGCTSNRGAIPWLLLGATPGHGKFERVTYIQRNRQSPIGYWLFVAIAVRDLPRPSV